MSDIKKLIEKVDKLEIILANIQTKLDSLFPEKNESVNIIKINFIRNRDEEVVLFTKYDKEKIRKHFSVSSVFEYFTKGNNNLWGGYYRDEITNTCNLVLADNKKALNEYILELGM